MVGQSMLAKLLASWKSMESYKFECLIFCCIFFEIGNCTEHYLCEIKIILLIKYL